MMNKDPLTKLSQEAIDRRMNPKCIIHVKNSKEIEEIRKEWEKNQYITVSPTMMNVEFIEIDKLKEELEAAATYIKENEVVHLKTKKNIPTVIQYQGRRYVYDDRN